MAITLEELTLAETFIYIIIGWVLIAVWQRFVENFFYNGLDLDREWPYHNFIVALMVSAVFFTLLVAANTIVRLDVFGVTGIFDIGAPESPLDSEIPLDLLQEGSIVQELHSHNKKDLEEEKRITERTEKTEKTKRKKKARRTTKRKSK